MNFTAQDIKIYFNIARSDPQNANCNDAQIALLIFYGLITDEQIKSNGNEIRKNFWSAVNNSEYGIKSVIQKFLENNNKQVLSQTGLCIEFTDQSFLDEVNNHCTAVTRNYPTYNLDNYLMGKLGEWAVYKALTELSDIWKSRSVYKQCLKKIHSQLSQEELTEVEKNSKKVPFSFDKFMLPSTPKQMQQGDGGVDLEVEYAQGYLFKAKLQIKTTRLSQNTSIDHICWQISENEIKTNDIFFFILSNAKELIFLVAGFLPTKNNKINFNDLPQSTYDQNKKDVNVKHLLHFSECLDYLDSVYEAWIKHGKHLGHEDSCDALDWSMRYNLYEKDYPTLETKATKFINKKYIMKNIDPHLALAIAKFEQGKWQEALDVFTPCLKKLIELFENNGDQDLGSFLQNTDIMEAKIPFGSMRLSEGILAMIDRTIICYWNLNQPDGIISSLKTGIEIIEKSNNVKLYDKQIEYCYNLVMLKSDDKDCKEFLRCQLEQNPDLGVNIISYQPGKTFDQKITGRLDNLYWEFPQAPGK